MKFIISSTTLLRGLQKVSGVLGSNNTLPILEDFLFELSDNTLRITASDLETTISVELTTDMSEDSGVIAVPAKMLLDIMKSLPNVPVTITIKGTSISILAGEGKYKLIGHESDEFPKIPEMENAISLDINAALLVNAFNKTLFATGNDELRPTMSGVFFEITEDNITFVATDAHKLVRYRRHDVKSATPASLILPKKPLGLLKTIMPEDEEVMVRFDFNETNAQIVFGDIVLICRLIEGKYPNYEAVIPTGNPFNLSVNRKALLNAIRRVSIFGNKSTHQVRFRISGKELLLTAEDMDFASEAKERLNCDYQGEDIEIGFNSRFIQEMLNTLEPENIIIELSAPNKAGIIISEREENNPEEILMLIMPVMLS